MQYAGANLVENRFFASNTFFFFEWKLRFFSSTPNFYISRTRSLQAQFDRRENVLNGYSILDVKVVWSRKMALFEWTDICKCHSLPIVLVNEEWPHIFVTTNALQNRTMLEWTLNLNQLFPYILIAPLKTYTQMSKEFSEEYSPIHSAY